MARQKEGAVVELTDRSITFRVDDVEPAREQLPEVRAHEALARELGGKPEACWDYTARVVDVQGVHGLMHAIHLAFSQHRPLVLTPDSVWLTIVQGIAHHVQADPERWRSRLVRHSGRMELQVTRDDFARGSPENPWPEVFSALARLVRDHGDAHVVDVTRAAFSTTGPVERAAYDVAVLDAFAPYFDYVLMCICGIPAVTLDGTTADWDDLAARVDRLDSLQLDLGWWTSQLRPIAAQFARARRGEVDVQHWRGIYKLRKAYGAEQINGWAARLVPYLKDHVTGRPTVRSWLLSGQDSENGITAASLPTGLASVPLTVLAQDGSARRLSLVAGHAGIAQEPGSLALRPRIGWAVTEAGAMDQLLTRLERGHAMRPPASGRGLVDHAMNGLPAALIQLYGRCDGATLHGRPGLRLLGVAETRQVSYDGERFSEDPGQMTSYRGRWIAWLSFAALEDGSRLAVDLDGIGRGHGELRVIRYRPGAIAPGRCRVVARSVEAALQHLLERPDAPFEDLGDPLA